MLLELTLVESITMTDLVQQLANELAVRPNQVEAAIRLIDEGASVPFIARYRKEVTQGLDECVERTVYNTRQVCYSSSTF